ncbi:hypothetical protein RF644_03785 [Kocuria sp. CPCC 205258]|uniref:hypothetical protein n=1 Tax=Kocuria sp. CPCC 205258 TaxID=3073552 RepID=UPI0034D60AC9
MYIDPMLTADILNKTRPFLNGGEHEIPLWVNALALYWIVTVTLLLGTAILYGFLLLLERGWENLLKHLARWLSIGIAVYCARLVAHGEAFFSRARFMLGIGFGYGNERRRDTSRDSLRRLPQSWIANLLAMLALYFAVVIEFIFFMLRLNFVNLIIWVGVLWYVGYLPNLVLRISEVDWISPFTTVPPSQIVALLALLVIFATVVMKSDVRGRTEFSKMASVECRKTLNLLKPHIDALYRLEIKHQENILDEISRFPTTEYLKEATAHDGLKWINGRLDRKSLTQNTSESNESQMGRHIPTALTNYRRPLKLDIQNKIKQNLECTRNLLQELEKNGYAYKISSIIPRGNFRARYELQHSTGSFYDAEFYTLESIEKSLAPHKTRLGRKVFDIWNSNTPITDQEKAIHLLEKLVGRTAAHARDDLWDSLLTAERLRRLGMSIVRSRRDRLIDRIKQ